MARKGPGSVLPRDVLLTRAIEGKLALGCMARSWGTHQFDSVPSADGDACWRRRGRGAIVVVCHLDSHEEKPHGQRDVLSCVRRFRSL